MPLKRCFWAEKAEMDKKPKPLSLHYRIRKETRILLEQERLKRLLKGQQTNLVDLISEAVEKTFGR